MRFKPYSGGVRGRRQAGDLGTRRIFVQRNAKWRFGRAPGTTPPLMTDKLGIPRLGSEQKNPQGRILVAGRTQA